MIVLDSGAVSRLAERSQRSAALIGALRRSGTWPAVVPSVVLVECLTGQPGRDAQANRLLKACDVTDQLPAELARRAALLRTRARRGSVVDALAVATAEPGGTVLTTDPKDLRVLADQADNVHIEPI
jgi:predicted nucleic acid-binding protein